MAEPLRSYERASDSPAIEPAASGIVVTLHKGAASGGLIARGAYRVLGLDRGALGSAAVRQQVWLAAIDQDTGAAWWGSPGGEAVVFAEEEPPTGAVEGWFNVELSACCGIPEDVVGPFDVTAVLGPFKSAPVEVQITR